MLSARDLRRYFLRTSRSAQLRSSAGDSSRPGVLGGSFASRSRDLIHGRQQLLPTTQAAKPLDRLTLPGLWFRRRRVDRIGEHDSLCLAQRTELPRWQWVLQTSLKGDPVSHTQFLNEFCAINKVDCQMLPGKLAVRFVFPAELVRPISRAVAGWYVRTRELRQFQQLLQPFSNRGRAFFGAWHVRAQTMANRREQTVESHWVILHCSDTDGARDVLQPPTGYAAPAVISITNQSLLLLSGKSAGFSVDFQPCAAS